ncbi:MAG TPA: hypothetical protein PKD00_00015 [Burkholderiales bacterium]|nr:hypothetical protein [Burkholderiales bacterium]
MKKTFKLVYIKETAYAISNEEEIKDGDIRFTITNSIESLCKVDFKSYVYPMDFNKKNNPLIIATSDENNKFGLPIFKTGKEEEIKNYSKEDLIEGMKFIYGWMIPESGTVHPRPETLEDAMEYYIQSLKKTIPVSIEIEFTTPLPNFYSHVDNFLGEFKSTPIVDSNNFLTNYNLIY